MAKLQRLPFMGSAISIGLSLLGCSAGTGTRDMGGGDGMGATLSSSQSTNGSAGVNPAGMNPGASNGTLGGGGAGSTEPSTVGAGANAATTSNGGGTASPNDVLPPPVTGICMPGVPNTSQFPRLTNAQYDAVVADMLGVTALSDGRPPSADFEPDSVGELPSTQWTHYQDAASQIAQLVMAGPHASDYVCGEGDTACLEGVVTSLGRQAFRRPLVQEEVDRFMSLADVQPQGTPEEIAEAMIFAFLIAPSFLMRTELDAPEVPVPDSILLEKAFALSNYEVASRLSFLLWNSIPDDTLNTAADNGELQTPDQIYAQAQRMVGEEFKDRVTGVITAAHRFYANIDEQSSSSRWGKTDHNTTDIEFPEYTDAAKAPLMAEVNAFFSEVGYSGTFEDLFLSNVAYINQDTAPLYGLSAADFGPDLKRVELQGNERPGFLTRAGFLSSYAHQRDTSPILRGVFILALIGGQTGLPDPSALTTQLPAGTYQTNREATQALTGVEESCKACHWQNINPPGYVLENFSAVGSIQTTDPVYGGPIDTAVDAVNFPDGAKPINNAYELMQGIVAGRKTKEIYAQKLVSYATGRSKNDYDQCTANMVADKLDAGGYQLVNLLADLTQADSFRLRTAAP